MQYKFDAGKITSKFEESEKLQIPISRDEFQVAGTVGLSIRQLGSKSSFKEGFDKTPIISIISFKEGNESQLKVRTDNYCTVMKSLSDWAEVRDREAERLKKLAEIDAVIAKVLESRLKNYLESFGKMKLKTKRFNPRVCKNGGKTPIKLNIPVEDLPSEYQITKKLINADLEALRKILEKGEELPFANLVERGTHLRYT